MLKRYYLNVQGEVQGVGFRYFTYNLARKYNLTGWVRNLYDGSVDVQVQGDEKTIEIFISCLKTTDLYADVTNITKEIIDIKKEENDFYIIP